MKTNKKILWVAGIFVMGLLLARFGGDLLARTKSGVTAETGVQKGVSFVWGLERLGTAADLTPAQKAKVRQLIRSGGLFFQTEEMKSVLNAPPSAFACREDCNYCCCDADGNNCYCCE